MSGGYRGAVILVFRRGYGHSAINQLCLLGIMPRCPLRSLPVGLGCPPELHVRRGHSGLPPGRVCAQALPCEGARDPVFEIITFEMILFQVYGSPDIPVDRVLDLTPD